MNKDFKNIYYAIEKANEDNVLQAISGEHSKQFTIDINEESGLIEITPLGGTPVTLNIIISTNKTTIYHLQTSEGGLLILEKPIQIQEFVNTLENGAEKFNELYGQKLSRRAKEQRQGRESLQSIDINKNKPTSFYRIFNKNYDPVIGDFLYSSWLGEKIMKKHYPKLVTHEALYVSDPKKELEKIVQQDTAKGIDQFFFQFNVHGAPNYLGFENKLTAKDILAITQQYPTATFILQTGACYGGGLEKGLIKEFKTHPDLAKNIIFLGGSPKENVGMSSRYGHEKDSVSGSHYLFFFNYYLNQGMSIGKAHDEADKTMVKHGLNNPRAIIPQPNAEKKKYKLIGEAEQKEGIKKT